MTTATDTEPLTEIQKAEIYSNLEMVGANMPKHQFAGWTDGQLQFADDWAKCVDRNANDPDCMITIPETPEHVKEWLDTEGQSDPVAMAQGVITTDAGAELEERSERLDKANRKLQAIRVATDEVDRAKEDWDESAQETKDFRKAHEGAVARLLYVIRTDVDQKELPFTDGPNESDGSETPASDWGTEPVSALTGHGLTPKKCEAIAEALKKHGKPQARVVDFRDWMNGNEWWHREVEGVGEKSLEPIIDALNSYYAANPEAEEIPIDDDNDKPEYELAVDDLKDLIEQCDALSVGPRSTEECIEFCKSVAEQAAVMQVDIWKEQRVTPDQRTAIDNWSDGVAKWEK